MPPRRSTRQKITPPPPPAEVSDSEEEEVERMEESDEEHHSDIEAEEEEDNSDDDNEVFDEENENMGLDSDDSEFEPTVSAASRKKKRKTAAATPKKSKSSRAKKVAAGIDRAPPTPKRSRVKTGKTAIRRAEAVVRSEKGKAKGKGRKTSVVSDGEEEEEEPAMAGGKLHPIVAQEDESSIFAAVRRGTVALTTVTDEWIERYSDNALDAIAELLTFVVNSSGCPEPITSQMLQQQDGDSLEGIVPDLVEKFPEVSEYPLISTHKSLRNFARNFLEFWEVLFNRGKESVLFREGFVDTLVSWMSSLSSSSVRAFRHTTTVALFQFVDSFIHLLKEMDKELEQLQKQLKSAKGKKQVQKQIDTMRTRQGVLKENIEEIFDGVFIHRYKDSVENIRALAMDSLGGWIVSDPETFLQDTYTKYMGWALNDRSPAVRECVLKGLAKIYDYDDWHGPMTRFTKKFLGRIVQMATSDISIPVSIEALKLLTALLRFGVLNEDDKAHATHIENVTALIKEENASVRHYAAHFIFFNQAKIIEQEDEEESATNGKRKRKSSKKKKKKKTLENADISLEDLLALMATFSSDCPAIPVYVVDAFWNLTKAFSEWEDMCDMLLGTEDNDEDDELEDKDSLNLVHALNAAVKKLHGSLGKFTTSSDTVKLPTKGKKRGKGKRMTKAEVAEEREEQIEAMTSALAPMLPQLIAKYQTDRKKIEDLIELPQFFNLDTYTNNQMQHHFDEFLKLLAELFWKQNNLNTFKKIAQTFHMFTTRDFTLKSRAENVLNEVVRQMIEKLHTVVEAFEAYQDHADSEESKQERYAMQLALQRISCFIQLMDFRLENLFQDMSRLLSARVRGANIEQESCALIVSITVCYFGWKVHGIMQSLRNGTHPSAVLEPMELNNLAKTKSTFTRQLMQLMDVGDFKLETTAFRTLCDFFTLFPADVPELEELQVMITDEEREGLIEFFHKSMAKRAEVIESPDDIDDDDDDDTEEKESVLVEDRLNRAIKAQQYDIAALAKAFINGTLPSDKSAGAMLSHFSRHQKSVSDTIKLAHGKLREKEPDTLWKHEFEALKIMFDRYAEEEETEDAYEQFVALAARLSLLHFWGRDQDLVHSVVNAVVKDVFDEISVRHRFLTGISKFVVKLNKDDATALSSLVEEKISGLHSYEDEPDDVKESVDEFKTLLRHVEAGRKSQQQRAKKDKKRARASKEQGEEEEEEEDIEDFSDEEAPESKRPRRTASRKLEFDNDSQDEAEEEKVKSTVEEGSSSQHSKRGQKRQHNDEEEEMDEDETQISEDAHESTQEEEDIKQTRTKRRRRY